MGFCKLRRARRLWCWFLAGSDYDVVSPCARNWRDDRLFGGRRVGAEHGGVDGPALAVFQLS